MNKIMSQIIEECRLRDMTQRELANKSGLTEASVCRYFKGERTPNLKNAGKMADTLGFELRLLKK